MSSITLPDGSNANFAEMFYGSEWMGDGKMPPEEMGPVDKVLAAFTDIPGVAVDFESGTASVHGLDDSVLDLSVSQDNDGNIWYQALHTSFGRGPRRHTAGPSSRSLADAIASLKVLVIATGK